jgi:murein DD-endopeptidase MepM/ murein hydrolase activator NlpD
MQLIWISGSTDKVKKINITARTLIKAAAVVSFVLVLIGIGIHFLGFRVAIQYSPELARNMGGVITVQEKDAIETSYRARLHELQNQLTQLTERIVEMKALKDRFADLATPAPVKRLSQEAGNKGGAYQPIAFKLTPQKSLVDELDHVIGNTSSLQQSIKSLENSWREQYEWLSQLPTGSPIQNQLGLSSNFGTRLDPFTNLLAQHPGIDFSAPSGTPIIASGNGTVTSLGYDAAYGNYLMISHSDGFVSKYAHARKIHVRQGQAVKRGQIIAEVGSTGRSTGPHLHYEITHNGKHVNPMQFLISSNVQLSKK